MLWTNPRDEVEGNIYCSNAQALLNSDAKSVNKDSIVHILWLITSIKISKHFEQVYFIQSEKP